MSITTTPLHRLARPAVTARRRIFAGPAAPHLARRPDRVMGTSDHGRVLSVMGTADMGRVPSVMGPPDGV